MKGPKREFLPMQIERRPSHLRCGRNMKLFRFYRR